MRHHDPHLGRYTPRGAVIRAAVELASALGDREGVRVGDDRSVIGLWRRD